MTSTKTPQKRKQTPSTAEPHTLLNFFGSKRFKQDSVSDLLAGPVASGAGKPETRSSEVIVISDDEDCTQITPAEDILDLSFSDPVDPKAHELEVIEDDGIENIDASDEHFALINESSKCLGNQLLADSVEFGTCSICGLLLLDSTEKEINEHISKCLNKPSGSASPRVDHNDSVAPQTNAIVPEVVSRTDFGTPKKANVLDTLMLSRQEREAWDSVDAAQAKRDTKGHRSDRRRKAPAGTKGNSKARKMAPFYKVMPGMPIAVDAFCYGKIPGVTAYFLSHAHSDHYTNLSSSWKNGPIYCSSTTANLIKHMLRVDPKWVHPLPDDQAIEIPDTGGVKVTLIDANHCPGSSLFVFTGKQTIDAGDSPVKSSFVGSDRQFTYLHCGDFRACPAQALHPAIHGKRLDTVYLDTTYLNPKYCFPPQALVIDACAELAKRYIQGERTTQGRLSKPKSLPTLLTSPAGKGGWFKPSPKMLVQIQTGTSTNPSLSGVLNSSEQRVLVVVGTYTIGKERVLKAIAKALSSKIYCNSRKHAVFMCQTDADLHAMLTKDSTAAQVHVLPLGQINIEGLSEYLVLHQAQFDSILGFRPTGWTYTPPTGQNMTPTIDQILTEARTHNYTASDLRPQRGSNQRVTIYGVPYSEHSSFRELTCFALSTDWGRMIATVNVGSAESRQKMQTWFEKWAKSRKDRGSTMVKHRCEDYW